MLINATVSAAVAPPALGINQDAVRGSSTTIDVASELAGSSPYSLDAGTLPIGLTLNTSTGQITGTPISAVPRRDLTISDGSANSVVFALGVTPKAGVPPPLGTFFNFDGTAATAELGLTTNTSHATWAALRTAMNTAVGDGGTAAAPKLHKLTYTGPDITSGVSLTGGTPDANSWVWIDGGGATIGNINMSTAGARYCVDDLTMVCSGNADAISTADGSYVMAYDCRMGSWYSTTAAAAEGKPTRSDYTGGEYWFEGCEFGFNGIGPKCSPPSNNALVDCLVHHNNADEMQYFNGGSGGFIYLVGNVYAGRHALSNPGSHGDFIQTFGVTGSPTTQMYENIIFGDSANYCYTGLRMGGTMDIQRNVFGITGTTIKTGGAGIWDQLLVIPPPDNGSASTAGSNWKTPETETKSNFISPYTVADVTGTMEAYTFNNAASIDALFPNLGGAVSTYTKRYNQSGGDMYVTPAPDITLHPAAWRSYVSTAYEPVGGWAAYGFENPANYGGIFSWGAAASATTITLSTTGASVSVSTLTFNCPVSGGFIWMFSSEDPVAPRWTQLYYGIDQDWDFNPAEDPSVNMSYDRVTTTGSQNFTLARSGATYVHVGYEAVDGSRSNIVTVTA